MKRPIIIWLTGLAALCVVGVALYVSFPADYPPQSEDADASQECSSCTLRHQSLGKRKETRDRERVELREIFENSDPDTQHQ